MKSLIFFLFTILFFTGFSQTTSDPCDSIFIHSVVPNATGQQIEVIVSNHSLDIMSYPGFILFNQNGDTIAKELVTYFGIGWNEQVHVLEIINQPALLFIGTLELHTHFYDSLRCTFPVAMDLSTGISEAEAQEVTVYPNPAYDWIQIDHLTNMSLIHIEIYNIYGKQMKTILNGNRIDISSFPNGIYHLQYKKSNSLKRIKFIVL